MINRTRFMLDVDSEGFPLQDTTMASYNMTVDRSHSVASAALLADHKCMRCANHLQGDLMGHNPPGWNEIDGVMLPRITWAEECNDGVVNGTLGFGS